MSKMTWQDVDSSMISGFGYDESKQVLEVKFNKGGTYRYTNVPKSVVEGLEDADSKGRYMHGYIIDQYPHQKL
ncbi:KTSC domain-containing protein [Anaerolineales bacterium HSG24]|nr:KTSC domain-containing protein [Anaerolineales bacterium HSG24]